MKRLLLRPDPLFAVCPERLSHGTGSGAHAHDVYDLWMGPGMSGQRAWIFRCGEAAGAGLRATALLEIISMLRPFLISGGHYAI